MKIKTDRIKIKRALISVTDKTDLIPLARQLVTNGCELISTGGTGKHLADAGLPFLDISLITGSPEAFGGRMKTISFAIESALLYDRERDAGEAEQLGITAIDMVICNLYAFEKYQRSGAALDELIEHIDIGGPTMIRAAAKNFKYVAAVTDIKDYPAVIKELAESSGALSYETRRNLMARAFNLTADYDAAIAQTMDGFCGSNSMRFSFRHGKVLRYGENSHQQASLYRLDTELPSLYDCEVLHGMEISYNNMLDLQAAVETVCGLNQSGCVIVKHNNPCGMAESRGQHSAFELAWAGDPVSAFGGIIAFNSGVNLDTVRFLQFDAVIKSQKKFIEIIAAPSFSSDALDYLRMHKNLRIVKFEPGMVGSPEELRVSNNMLLRQSKDVQLYNRIELMTGEEAEIDGKRDMIEFGLKAVRHIKSNAIAVVYKNNNSELTLIGMGSGQPNRLDSISLAIGKAKKNLNATSLSGYNVILVSDAFFPFEDNVDAANDAGIKVIVQPGGSVRDKYVIERCAALGINLIFTGIRHFKH